MIEVAVQRAHLDAHLVQSLVRVVVDASADDADLWRGSRRLPREVEVATLGRSQTAQHSVQVGGFFFAQRLAQLGSAFLGAFVAEQREHHRAVQAHRTVIGLEQLRKSVDRRRTLAVGAQDTEIGRGHLETGTSGFHVPFDGFARP